MGNLKRLHDIKYIHEFLCSTDCYMVMKTVEICEGFTIENTLTRFLYIMFSFKPLNMTDKSRLYHIAYIHRVSHMSSVMYLMIARYKGLSR